MHGGDTRARLGRSSNGEVGSTERRRAELHPAVERRKDMTKTVTVTIEIDCAQYGEATASSEAQAVVACDIVNAILHGDADLPDTACLIKCEHYTMQAE